MINDNYLTNIPQEVENYGLCKTLYVRNKIIHIKHILTEIFVRKNYDINQKLSTIGWNMNQYLEYMTNLMRRIHKIDREYIQDIEKIVKEDRSNFFPLIELYKGLNNVIVLDFDEVITKNTFKPLYNLCLDRCKTFICSANPNIDKTKFIKNDLKLPDRIYSMKGKKAKLNKLLEINSKYDNVFYIDNESEYLEFAWLFGINTFIYKENKIKKFTLCK